MSWVCGKCGHENGAAKQCGVCNGHQSYLGRGKFKPSRSYFCRKCGRIGWTTKLRGKVACKNCGVMV